MVYQHINFVIGAPLNKVPIQDRCSSSIRKGRCQKPHQNLSKANYQP